MSHATRLSVALPLLLLAIGCPPKPPATGASTPPPTSATPRTQVDDYERVDDRTITDLLQDVHFDFDRADIRDDQKPVLEENAAVLREHPSSRVVIEGHCDERGSVEYNLALGERRAASTERYLVGLGVDPGRLTTVSYGKELPADPGHGEEAWAANRRAHFVATR